LKLFKIQDIILIKNEESSRVLNSIEFDGIYLDFSRIEGI
jgi:hypothetical protein